VWPRDLVCRPYAVQRGIRRQIYNIYIERKRYRYYIYMCVCVYSSYLIIHMYIRCGRGISSLPPTRSSTWNPSTVVEHIEREKEIERLIEREICIHRYIHLIIHMYIRCGRGILVSAAHTQFNVESVDIFTIYI